VACLELGISTSFVPGFPRCSGRSLPDRELVDSGDQLGRQTQLGDGIGALPLAAAKSDCCGLWRDRSVVLWLCQCEPLRRI
jgi:hypothetical protein